MIELRSPALQADSLPAEPRGKPKNTAVRSLFLLCDIFATQELKWSLLHCRQIPYQLSYQGSSELRSLRSRSSKHFLSRPMTKEVIHLLPPMSPSTFLSQSTIFSHILDDNYTTQRSSSCFPPNPCSLSWLFIRGNILEESIFISHLYTEPTFVSNNSLLFPLPLGWWSETLAFKRGSCCNTTESTKKNMCHCFDHQVKGWHKYLSLST